MDGDRLQELSEHVEELLQVLPPSAPHGAGITLDVRVPPDTPDIVIAHLEADLRLTAELTETDIPYQIRISRFP